MDALDRCDESMDLIVLPESANVPALAHTKEQMEESVAKYTAPLLQKASETAHRCHALLFISCTCPADNGKLRNSALAFNRDGEEAGRYYKQHLVESEMYKKELDRDYSREFEEEKTDTAEKERIPKNMLLFFIYTRTNAYHFGSSPPHI